MGRRAAIVLYLLAMIAAVVCVDIVFFRHHFTERLIANIAIVLAFAVGYFWFARPRPDGRES